MAAGRLYVLALFAISFYYASLGQQILPAIPWDNVVVLGQPNYTTAAANTYAYPIAVAVVNQKLIVSDYDHNRVLVYNNIASLSNNVNPDTSLNAGNINANGTYKPLAVAGYLRDNVYSIWVGDTTNHSVVRYSEPYSFNQAVDINATVGTVGGWSTQITGITVDLDTNSVYIADGLFNNVKRYSLNNLAVVTATYGGTGTAVSATTLSFPSSILLCKTGDVWILDTRNSRLLRYPRGSTTPNLVIGQPSFTSSVRGNSASQLNFPGGAAVDESCGTIWVADTINNRILKYVAPFSTGMNASQQLGEVQGTAINQFSVPTSLAIDTANQYLWITDGFNNRVIGGRTSGIVAVTPSPSTSHTTFTATASLTQSASQSASKSPVALSSGQSASSSASPTSATPSRSFGSSASSTPSSNPSGAAQPSTGSSSNGGSSNGNGSNGSNNNNNTGASSKLFNFISLFY